jgi:hypothetical protein
VSASAHPPLHRFSRRRGHAPWLIVGVLLVVGAAVVIERVLVSASVRAPNVTFVARPDLDSDIAGLVTGTARMAPGVTAYVLGPHGAWLDSAGVANVKAGETVRPDARMRLRASARSSPRR